MLISSISVNIYKIRPKDYKKCTKDIKLQKRYEKITNFSRCSNNVG
jgi:hypothetical protein